MSRPSSPRLLAIAISAAAVVIAVVHVIWPDLKVDAVTLVLLAIAAIPWLGPIFKSIELPGGWKVEHQEIRQEVQEVQRRIDSVERLLFTGDTTPALEQKLSDAVRGFAGFLLAIDDAFDVPPPTVRLRRGLNNAQYDDSINEIQLDPDFATDDYAVFREYAHHVLMAHGAKWDRDGLESGLADYLVASYLGHPALGPGLAKRLNLRKLYVRNLKNDIPYQEERSAHEKGEVWGAAFWEIRERLGQATADRTLTRAWLDPASNEGKAAFPALVVSISGEGSLSQAFRRRGLG